MLFLIGAMECFQIDNYVKKKSNKIQCGQDLSKRSENR